MEHLPIPVIFVCNIIVIHISSYLRTIIGLANINASTPHLHIAIGIRWSHRRVRKYGWRVVPTQLQLTH